ncbi:MAG: RagB/SusD family nutrient uptake outer membrane protein [Tannerella sp.]|jgi:hypothetical protein|nr:RagB/SusD family nutrient uptake outer membrane protein [Tannerella sp.]
MKNIKYTVLSCTLVIMSACNDLNLNPLSEGSSGNWYSTEEEIVMSINDLFRDVFWPLDDQTWDDDYLYRESLTPINNGSITSDWSDNATRWLNAYKAITRANTLLYNFNRAEGKIAASTLERYEGIVRFARASFYSYLIARWGDVPFYTEPLTLDEAFQMGRIAKSEVLKNIYEDYDYAAAHVPETNNGGYPTKGAALAMKARIALYMQDWNTASTAAQACINLGVYKLHEDYPSLFLTSTKNAEESIFLLPRSIAFGVTIGTQNEVTRNRGGWGSAVPTWELFCSFLCTDGLPIDESPLFDPHNPYKNRDPRCTYTCVEPGTAHLGFIFEPHPDSLQVLNLSTGQYQINNDTRANAQYTSYNGLMRKKGVDEDWTKNSYRTDPDKIIIRYADVLLIYAEAKIEAGSIDQSVLDAMNQVRARAYGVDYTATDQYPAITTTNQAELRKILRIERRMEFSFENLRYMDLIRWRLAEIALNKARYGMLDVAELREKVVKPGLWFYPETPDLDENGIANFDPMYEKGLIKRLTVLIFDKSKQYLWPIPSKDILINSNLKQNEGY